MTLYRITVRDNATGEILYFRGEYPDIGYATAAAKSMCRDNNYTLISVG
jgi:hypothetical protein